MSDVAPETISQRLQTLIANRDAMAEICGRLAKEAGMNEEQIKSHIEFGCSYENKEIKKQLEREALSDKIPVDKWVQVGTIGVDAGCVTVGDPCYFPVPWIEYERLTGLDNGSDGKFDLRDNVTGAHYDYHLPKKELPNINSRKGDNANKAEVDLKKDKYYGDFVTVSSGYGDGAYPVYVKYTEDTVFGGTKRIAELRVVFIESDKEEEL